MAAVMSESTLLGPMIRLVVMCWRGRLLGGRRYWVCSDQQFVIWSEEMPDGWADHFLAIFRSRDRWR
jgi:hypothetical protein